MLQELKKKSFQSSLKLTIFLTIIGLILVVFFTRNALYAITGFTDPAQFNAFDGKPDELLNRCYPILLFIGGIALLGIAVYRLIKGARGGFLRSLMWDIANAGYTESAIDSDYAGAKIMDKWGIRLGQLMIYDISSTKARAIPNTKILWAYTDLQSYPTKYGRDIHVNTLVLHVEGEAKEYRMVFSEKANATQMLQQINEKFPWVVTEYSEKLKKLFNQNRAEFMQLRYHTCEHLPL